MVKTQLALALFTIAKIKKPKCPLTEEWIKKIHTHTHRVLFSHKKE